MGDGQERPRAGDPPQLNAPLEILKELLQTQRDRLQVALRIEKERSIVFPETTVIIRDIERLTLEIEKRESDPPLKEAEPKISAMERAAERARAKGFV
jgi:hypothetical protein